MWTHEYSLTTDADASTLWEVLADVDGWPRWNDGIESITLDGPLAVGTSFRMTPPGEGTITSTIVELDAGSLLADHTDFDGLAIRVAHRLAPADGGGTTVTYRVDVTGDAPDDVLAEVGTMISADFPQVLAGLAAAAGGSSA